MRISLISPHFKDSLSPMPDPDSATFFPGRVVTSVLQALGLICTIWRICFRLKIGRFWWEDAWAAVSFLACLVSLVGRWMCSGSSGLVSIIGFWFHTVGFTCSISAVHLSILFSIIRIIQPGSPLHRFACFCATFFVVCWSILVSAKVWQCASNPGWVHQSIDPICTVMSPILIFEITSDCVSVGILVVLPLRMLWRVKLPRRQRRMLLSIFASSIVLSIAALFHMLGRVLDNSSIVTASIDFEIALSIIVCNLLVVVTFIYRLLSRDGIENSTAATTYFDDFTQPRGVPSEQTALTLTTVDADLFTASDPQTSDIHSVPQSC